MIHDPAGRISLHRNPERIRVWAGDTLLADTRAAIELRETDYSPRQYIPREDVVMEHLKASPTHTNCPFKGDASYFSVDLREEKLTDAAWSYERPLDAVAEIAGYLAFDTRVVTETAGEDAKD